MADYLDIWICKAWHGMANYMNMQEKAEIMRNIATVIASIVAFMEDEYQKDWVTVESSKGEADL